MTTLETTQVYSTCNCSEGVVYTHQTGPLPLSLRFITRRGPGRLQSALQLTAAQQERNNKERLQRITVLNAPILSQKESSHHSTPGAYSFLTKSSSDILSAWIFWSAVKASYACKSSSSDSVSSWLCIVAA